MRIIALVSGFVFCLVMCFGIIKTRGEVVKAGNKIIILQKELWKLKDMNAKLENEYRRIATPDNLVEKNEELNLSLVPPHKVIRVQDREKPDQKMVSMKTDQERGKKVHR